MKNFVESADQKTYVIDDREHRRSNEPGIEDNDIAPCEEITRCTAKAGATVEDHGIKSDTDVLVKRPVTIEQPAMILGGPKDETVGDQYPGPETMLTVASVNAPEDSAEPFEEPTAPAGSMYYLCSAEQRQEQINKHLPKSFSVE